ncbi:MAG: 3-isopropylmalate dehydratase small subunit [Acidimicrobiia bacterium]
MRPISVVKGRMAPLYRPDIDTDQIIPKQFLKRIERTGFGPFLFYDWAHLENGEPNPDFVLNREEYRGAKVLLAGANFGCGSSREHAVWAIQDHGFEAIIAPSFADIFFNNCSKVGLVCVCVEHEIVEELVGVAERNPSSEVIINVESQTISWNEGGSEVRTVRFEMDHFVRERLLNGWDDIAMTERLMDQIARFEEARPEFYPSIRPGAGASLTLSLKGVRREHPE